MRMIPSTIDEETTPPGEVQLYRKLEQSSSNWVAIHSLDLAPSNHNRRTEIDFVLLIPDQGIFCIEVKSHWELYFDGDNWHPPSIKKSPFKQAQDARFALLRRIKDRMAALGHVPVLHCCIFPFAPFSVSPGLSILPFEVMDRDAFAAYENGDKLCAALERMFRTAVKNDPQIFPLKKSLKKQEIDQFIDFCFPIRTRKPEKSAEWKQRERELEQKLREQQKPVLQLISCNDRVLIEGGAGTGKTLIGLEVARNKAAGGVRVAYLCFNSLIGNWVKQQLESDEIPNLTGGPILSVLMNMTGIEVPVNPDQQYWDSLPVTIQEKLTDPDREIDFKFDYLVLDEAQDILGRPDLLDCVELLLDGGLQGGSYLILGDFSNQVLTNRESVERYLIEVRSMTARSLLSENCRNYRSIGDIALRASAASQNTYSGYRRTGGGLNSWDLDWYDSQENQELQIRKCLDKVLSDGLKAKDVTILSFCAIKYSVIPSLQKSGVKMSQVNGSESSKIQYSTVSAYKGMENKVIILTDVSPTPHMERNLFYTGITRATERVYIFCHEAGRQQLAEWISQGAKA